MDADLIDDLIQIAASPDGLAMAQKMADKALIDDGHEGFPTNACAATLSALLQLAGIDVKMTLGAGRLAERLGGVSAKSRHWVRVLPGDHKPGDVGVTFDEDERKPGADHIYLVVQCVTTDEMIVADNQARVPHQRFASGRNRTPTEYFLRAPPAASITWDTQHRRSKRDDLIDLAAASPLARYQWNQRGRAPLGYIKGMALAYADAYQKLKADDPIAVAMARAAASGDSDDALSWYETAFAELNMHNIADGSATLRHLFVLMTGLGMRESSGRACEGRDRSAENVSADTAEAGLFQSSYNLHSAHPLIDQAIQTYAGSTDLQAVFMEGVAAKANDLENFGTGPGRAFQALNKACPALAVLVAGIGLRHRMRHWGPIKRRSAELNSEADILFGKIEERIDAEGI